MASRTLNPGPQTFEREVVKIYAEIAIGTSGAPTLTRGKGVASVAGGGTTGKYTLTLQDKYKRLLDARCTVKRATAAGLQGQLDAEDVAGAKTVEFGIVDYDTPALTDPTSGDVLFCILELLNSDT